ncbi:hypothetical protein L3X38_003338 [Prunus dulcis]|uniref:Uncharacterized protein n=1 Tax=Prunus dulcis TaxID=3755 RepID=A0AAD5F1R3_PRUDU|nr:hypothetical protein L3X38_003338 [Prunus dulcis]
MVSAKLCEKHRQIGLELLTAHVGQVSSAATRIAHKHHKQHTQVAHAGRSWAIAGRSCGLGVCCPISLGVYVFCCVKSEAPRVGGAKRLTWEEFKCQTRVEKLKAFFTYVTTSIIEGREVIVNGSRWQVLDGNEIRIWVDKWIPLSFNKRLYPTNEVLVNETTLVSEIINPSTKDWDLLELS